MDSSFKSGQLAVKAHASALPPTIEGVPDAVPAVLRPRSAQRS